MLTSTCLNKKLLVGIKQIVVVVLLDEPIDKLVRVESRTTSQLGHILISHQCDRRLDVLWHVSQLTFAIRHLRQEELHYIAVSKLLLSPAVQVFCDIRQPLLGDITEVLQCLALFCRELRCCFAFRC